MIEIYILFWFKFGGGRTIQPGDSVETAEERIAREERTKKLLTAYKESIGLNIDPELKLECEKVFPRHLCSSFFEDKPVVEVNCSEHVHLFPLQLGSFGSF